MFTNGVAYSFWLRADQTHSSRGGCSRVTRQPGGCPQLGFKTCLVCVFLCTVFSV
jgi:hypothetical protein